MTADDRQVIERNARFQDALDALAMAVLMVNGTWDASEQAKETLRRKARSGTVGLNAALSSPEAAPVDGLRAALVEPDAHPFRWMPDGTPCWCVSADEPHEGWQHAPACQALLRERIAAALAREETQP